MALFIASLNSGSNGNCYYVGNERDAVLIDAGISCRETEKRMRSLGLKIEKVRAIFITHEHSDHIRGLTVLSEKYEIPVYITPRTMSYGRLFVKEHLQRLFTADEPVDINGLTITAFVKLHDAIEPHSFVVSGNNVTIGVFTDIGSPCDRLVHYFKQCHAAYLEANYDVDMLDKGRYPIYLKNRIRSGYGHLSNKQALELFLEHRPSHMSHLFLAHLSKDNNCPDLAVNLFRKHAGGTFVDVASRYGHSELFRIANTGQIATAIAQAKTAVTQSSLF